MWVSLGLSVGGLGSLDFPRVFHRRSTHRLNTLSQFLLSLDMDAPLVLQFFAMTSLQVVPRSLQRDVDYTSTFTFNARHTRESSLRSNDVEVELRGASAWQRHFGCSRPLILDRVIGHICAFFEWRRTRLHRCRLLSTVISKVSLPPCLRSSMAPVTELPSFV